MLGSCEIRFTYTVEEFLGVLPILIVTDPVEPTVSALESQLHTAFMTDNLP